MSLLLLLLIDYKDPYHRYQFLGLSDTLRYSVMGLGFEHIRTRRTRT